MPGMRLYFIVFSTFLLFASPALAERDGQDEKLLHPSGLPLPRFVSLKSETVNVRVGPGTRYPLKWVYKRKGWPVEIIEEFGYWRKIRDVEGATGWVHKNLVASQRTGLVRNGLQMIYRRADEKSGAALRAEDGVLLHIQQCDAQWCEIELSDHSGWIRKEAMYGVRADERIEE